MSGGGAAAGAAAAAAAAAEAARREEEEMTPYSSSDLNEDWEFKIVRSSMSQFKKPEVLRQVLDDEARAGWVLVEKFDNQRIRLKRRTSAQKNDASLDFDPYRSRVGMSDGALAGLILGIFFGILIAVALVVMLLNQ